MSFDIKTAMPTVSAADTVPYEGDSDLFETVSRSARVVTVVATSIAVLIVAVIAVLMGMS